MVKEARVQTHKAALPRHERMTESHFQTQGRARDVTLGEVRQSITCYRF